MSSPTSKGVLGRASVRVQKASPKAIEFIKGFESFVPYVYDDLVPPVKGKYREWNGGAVRGTLTIGYGHTDAAKHPLKIKQGLRITEEEACEILDVDLDDCEEDVRKALKVPVSQGQFDALVSFAFNCGGGNMRNIANRINRGDADEARAAFDLYTKSKGKTLRGLQRRRDGEQALWDSADPAPIAVADTFHPAEIDTPEAPVTALVTAADLVGVSRKITLLSRIKQLFAWTGIGGGGAYSLAEISGQGKEYVHVVSDLVKDNAVVLFIAGLVVGFVVAHVLEQLVVEDHNSGRYTPSGGG